jgi:hypothetical protein
MAKIDYQKQHQNKKVLFIQSTVAPLFKSVLRPWLRPMLARLHPNKSDVAGRGIHREDELAGDHSKFGDPRWGIRLGVSAKTSAAKQSLHTSYESDCHFFFIAVP